MSADADYEIARRKFREKWTSFPCSGKDAPKWAIWRGDCHNREIVAVVDTMELADRIEAAVNFCRNLPTDMLQKHVAMGGNESGVVTGEMRLLMVQEISE